MKTKNKIFLSFVSSIFFFSVLSSPGFSFIDQELQLGVKESVKNILKTDYLQLLMEKGICDSQGREIEQRLSALLERSAGNNEKQILAAALKLLNYMPNNLGSFPQCAFDRPVGHKLTSFGHTKVSENIDAKAEASACPVGGIGSGSFEWTMSGNFRYWFLKSGWMVDDTVWANQFHVYMRQNQRSVAQTLSTDFPPGNELQSWAWNYPEGEGSYFALYPKSGFSYETNQDLPVKIAVTQFSPVIAHNYRETSYPVAVYKWILANPHSVPAEVSIMLTWQNMVGWKPLAEAPLAHPSDFMWSRKSSKNINRLVNEGNKKGILFTQEDVDVQSGNAMTGSMCIAAAEVPGKMRVFHHVDFNPQGNGREVWDSFSRDGTLSNSSRSRSVSGDDALAGAIAVKVILNPKEHLEFPMAVAWDFPYYEFEKGVKYRRKYTEFYDSGGQNAFDIAAQALDNFKEWEGAVDVWQKEIIDDHNLPDWFKQALFNELYVLSETSIWDASTDLHTYLESVDYLMYGTFDVDAYSSWHLLKLWPELEKNNMRFFSKTVDWDDPAYKVYTYAQVMPDEVPEDKLHYYWSTNKVSGMIPHDIGSPRGRPWVILNAFDWQNGNVWKDLNPKFPLRAYRDFIYTDASDYQFLLNIFQTSVTALDTLEQRFADPENHIPLNEGIPDQTYDTWKMKGESAFVTVLWLAALKTTMHMGELLMEQGIMDTDSVLIKNVIEKYRNWFLSGRQALQKLWNVEGGYFNIDAYTDDIMTDQLFGLWYTKIMGLEEQIEARIIPIELAKKTLRTIYDMNVLGFGNGLLGAVNGRTSQGEQLLSQQGDEVWIGTSYAYASNCLLHGLTEEGWQTAYGVYHVVYSPYGQGYFFKSPEAYCNPLEKRWDQPGNLYGENLFRAMKYMRPGAVWAVLEAADKK